MFSSQALDLESSMYIKIERRTMQFLRTLAGQKDKKSELEPAKMTALDLFSP